VKKGDYMTKSLYKFAAFLTTAAAVIVLVALPARAQALVAIENETVPITVLAKPCSINEMVTFTGTLHSIIMVSRTPSGRTMYHYLMRTNVWGFSSSGVEYRYSRVNTGVVTLQDNLNVTANSSVTFQISAPGPEDDLQLHHVYHVNFYPDGTIRRTHDYFSSECR